MDYESEAAAAAAAAAEQEAAAAAAAAAAAQHAHPLGFAGKVPKPKPYDGRATDADDWVFTMDNYLNITHAGNDYERIVVATYYLEGDARKWWRFLSADTSKPEYPRTWQDFCNALLSTFRPINPAESARDTLARLRQVASVSAYAAQIRSAALQIPGITQDELKDRFIRGLKPDTQKETRMRNPDTFEAAVQLAERFDKLRWNLNPRKAIIPNQPFRSGGNSGPVAMELGAATVSCRTANAGPNDTRRPKLTPNLRQQLIQEGKCFYCRRKGHMALNCPERRQRQ
jgi:hypothetical protein